MIGDLIHMMPSVAAALGDSSFDTTLDLPKAPRAVVLVIDGLGYEQLVNHYELAPYLSSLIADPLYAGVPSTTATSLTSLATGQSPGQHGLVGYTMRVPGTVQRINALTWDQDVDAVTWQPYSPVLAQIRDRGVSSVGINLAKFEGSGLTQCTQRGVDYVAADTPWDRTEAAVAFFDRVDRGLIYTYEPWLDNKGHGYGIDSDQWREALSGIDRDMRTLRDQLDDQTLLIITADHGMVDIAEDNRFDIDSVPQLRNHVVLIAGEARFRHIYTESGFEHDVADTWEEILGEKAMIKTREEVIGLNWFGEVRDEVRERIGDVVVAAVGDFAMFSSKDFPREMSMTGFHGSVSDAERRIPFLVDM